MNNKKGFFALVETESNSKPRYYHTFQKGIKKGDNVIVETELGEELGTIVSNLKTGESISNSDGFLEIKRVCSSQDLQNFEENKTKIILAETSFKKNVGKLKLDMKLVSTHYNLDCSKILFEYFSESRVDFRELLSLLSSELKCRIELKQIGARDRSKSIGGIGICGLPLCCKRFLNDFEGISINMAKNQFLSINSQKISGPCGKLLCCLSYENSFYEKERKNFPSIGYIFKYNNDKYRVSSINIISGKIRIENYDRSNVENLSLEEYNKIPRSK